MLARMFRSPGMYIQGPGETSNLYRYAQLLGSRYYIIIDAYFYHGITNLLEKTLPSTDHFWIANRFEGEITHKKVAASIQTAQGNGIDLVIGIGGGKTLDYAKAVADAISARQILVPTLASSDAASSSLSIIYSEDSSTREIKQCRFNPDLILVDSSIIIQAPSRYIAAGIGDAVATYFEARAIHEAGDNNGFAKGFKITHLGLQAAKLCYDTILANSEAALASLKIKENSIALEHVIEANILLSGVGFENSGCAGAHSISAGFSALSECRNCMHGEKVAFGTLCQLLLEGRHEAEIEEVYGLFQNWGLPLSLRDLGVSSNVKNAIKKVAEESMKGTFWDYEPFEVKINDVIDCIEKADIYGEKVKEKIKK